MKQPKNKLRVNHSTFESDLSFNEWARKVGVSSLVPEQFERWDSKLDKLNEHEKRMMIRSIYEKDASISIGKRILSSIKQLINKKECQEKTD
jgi:hypothetical protein